jgi:CheY-like chemotaxis protein
MSYILIVEDDPRMADTLASMVRLLGYEATAVHNARMAIEASTRERPELILLDQNLPGVNGVEVCRFIKRDPLLGDTPVIFVSVEGRQEIIEAAKEAGAAAYLVKPIGLDELETTIAEAFVQLGKAKTLKDQVEPVKKERPEKGQLHDKLEQAPPAEKSDQPPPTDTPKDKPDQAEKE